MAISDFDQKVKKNTTSDLLVVDGFALSFSGKGLTSGRNVSIKIKQAKPGSGIVFDVRGSEGTVVRIPAKAEYVVSTLRNVVVGKGGVRLCIIEHLMAAAVLYGLDDLLVEVDGPELPIGDGSASIWFDLFRNSGVKQHHTQATIDLSQPVIACKGDRSVIAVPDEKFSVTYLMDWDHPKLGKKWQTWSTEMPIDGIGIARTFGTLKENQLLGLDNEVVSLTDVGFTKELHFADEPVRHKILDLVGDLALIGFNPLKIKARFISFKGGHELDVQLAKKLASVLAATNSIPDSN